MSINIEVCIRVCVCVCINLALSHLGIQDAAQAHHPIEAHPSSTRVSLLSILFNSYHSVHNILSVVCYVIPEGVTLRGE